MKIIVCGGGTGGHIYASLAIADYFKKQDENTEILYIGGKYGIENKILPNYDYRFETIDIKGFQRKISFENIKRIFKSATSTIKMRKILSKEKPDLVIGTGGYVCGPVIYMASLMKIKTAILEQNVFMGVTNKILAKKVDYIFYGFEDSVKRYLFKNVYVSGNPVRTSEFDYDKSYSRNELGYSNDEKIILSVGGSGGSEKLNNSIKGLINYAKEKNIRLIHICGESYIDDMKEYLKDINYDKFELFPYLKNIGKYMQSADVVICSAGAGTLSEVAYLGKPMLVIPKANTAENHQEYNAKMIQDFKAGYYIKENELNDEKLVENIDEIMYKNNNLEEMSKNSKNLYKGDPCKIIYDIIMNKNDKKVN